MQNPAPMSRDLQWGTKSPGQMRSRNPSLITEKQQDPENGALVGRYGDTTLEDTQLGAALFALHE